MPPSDSSLATLNPEFSAGIRADAIAILRDVLTGEAATHAAQRIALALEVLAKKTPSIMECTPGSVAEAVAMSVLTGLIPGGAMPTCYVLPRKSRTAGMELNWQLGFRGMVQLCQRAGFAVSAYPVYPGRVPEFDAAGRYVIPRARLAPVERTVENMIGVVVKVRRIADGVEFADAFVEADLIEARRSVSDAYQRGAKTGAQDWERKSPWFQWPEEMALKTAIRYVVSRGMVPVDDVAQRALEADARGDIIEGHAEVVQAPVTRPTGRAALGIGAPAQTVAMPDPVAERVVVEVSEPTLTPLQAKAAAAVEAAKLTPEDIAHVTGGKPAHEWDTAALKALSAIVQAKKAAATPTDSDEVPL